MWRSYFWAFALVNSTILCSVAREPDPIVVVVPDPGMATEVSAKLPGVRISGLQVHADESNEVVNARAISLRLADDLVFDHSKESLRLAMFREGLQMQGVVAIDVRPSSQPLYKNAKPANAPPFEQLAKFEQLASLLAHFSTNRE